MAAGARTRSWLDGTVPGLDCEFDASDAVFIEVGGTLHPDTGAQGEACDTADNAFVDVTVPPPARRFATAWTDLDGDHVYNEAIDSLIAKLVDTNRDGVVSIGDTVTTGRYPLTFAATTFGTFTDTSHTVTTVGALTPEQVTVRDGSSQFWWYHTQAHLDIYGETVVPNPAGDGTQFIDNATAGSGGACDQVWAVSISPSAPDTAVPQTDSCSPTMFTDETFLDVSLNLP